jgi:hypothetical protein
VLGRGRTMFAGMFKTKKQRLIALFLHIFKYLSKSGPDSNRSESSYWRLLPYLYAVLRIQIRHSPFFICILHAIGK